MNIQNEPLDVLRLGRFKAGETLEEIAESSGVFPGTVAASVRRAQAREEMLVTFELIELWLKGALDNERLRKQVRKLFPQYLNAIEILLSGRRTLIHTNEFTGEVVLVDIEDPDVLAMGLEQFRRSTSMEERPVGSPNANVPDESIMDVEVFRPDAAVAQRILEAQKRANARVLETTNPTAAD